MDRLNNVILSHKRHLETIFVYLLFHCEVLVLALQVDFHFLLKRSKVLKRSNYQLSKGILRAS